MADKDNETKKEAVIKKNYAGYTGPEELFLGTLDGSASVKAVGDWELDVLAVPFGGPDNGKDKDGEYFSSRTELHLDRFNPLVTYYHGYDEKGHPQGDPEFIGEITPDSWTKRGDGWWARVVLNKLSDYAGRVWQGAKDGIARASSGSIEHLVRKEHDGEITRWPLGELALFDTGEGRQPANNYAVALPVMKSVYDRAGIDLPDLPGTNDPEGDAKGEQQRAEPVVTDTGGKDKTNEENIMDEKEVGKMVADGIAEALQADREAEATKKEQEAAEQERTKAAVDKAVKEAEEKAAKDRRPESKAPVVAKTSDIWKYDNLTPEDQAVLVGILDAGKRSGESRHGATNPARQALAIKLQEAAKSDNKARRDLGRYGVNAMKAAGMPIKGDEIQQQDLTSYGDEWVSAAWSNALWESIRTSTFVAEMLPKIEVPAGAESITIPLESGDPTFYKVSEATDTQTSGWPNTTITSSQMGTAQKTLSLAKMGARVLWSGELEEDSIIPWVSQLRTQLVKAGAEQLEHAIIDGDTDETASTNINDIAGTPGGTEIFLLFNGFRKSPLVTTTANARSGGALTAEDYLETLKLMGTAGQNAADIAKVAFIVDANTYWKSLELSEVKTKDVFVAPTIENGTLNGIYGYKLYRSYFMHYNATNRKAEATGKIDIDTQADNTTGSILAVRWDQWLLGYRRRMTIETTRIARADTTEIVALSRLGLAQRDEEASAITYNITV